jgi:hypothetical protein
MTPRRVDPLDDPTQFNPLDYANLTKNVVDELMTRAPESLPIAHRFRGAGVYALYYVGTNPDYAPVRSTDAAKPIYVGKAVPAGARKGMVEIQKIGSALQKRLSEHTKSIEAGADLEITDFRCRYLVVVPLWIVMAEQFLIRQFKPLWNLRLDGFGNHDPGSGRHNSEISWWDARHPGRSWAARLRQTRTKDQALERIESFWNAAPAELEAEAQAAVDRETNADA